MNWLSIDHSGDSTNLSRECRPSLRPEVEDIHVSRPKEFATMYLPSGDQRGPVLPTDPGSCDLPGVEIKNADLALWIGWIEAENNLVSVGRPVRAALNPALPGAAYAGRRLAKRRCRLHVLRKEEMSENRIVVPSGDHRGRKASIGGSLNCTGLLPSRSAFHRMPSGNET